MALSYRRFASVAYPDACSADATRCISSAVAISGCRSINPAAWRASSEFSALIIDESCAPANWPYFWVSSK
jgi:hypothetical protein